MKAKYTLWTNVASGDRYIRIAATDTAPEQRVFESEDPAQYSRLRKLAIANRRQRDRSEVMRDLGMIKTPYGWE